MTNRIHCLTFAVLTRGLLLFPLNSRPNIIVHPVKLLFLWSDSTALFQTHPFNSTCFIWAIQLNANMGFFNLSNTVLVDDKNSHSHSCIVFMEAVHFGFIMLQLNGPLVCVFTTNVAHACLYN